MLTHVKMMSVLTDKPILVNSNMSFRPGGVQNDERPLVLVYGWLAAKAKHMHKYGDFYVGKGFDVLHIKVKPNQILWPTLAQGVVSQLLDFVKTPEHIHKPILVHGFSVGGYLYGETLVKVINDPEYQDVGKRIQGQIFDSPVDFEGVPRGTGMALSNVPVVQKSIKLSLEMFLAMFKNQTQKHYHKSSAAFHNNELQIPSLMLHSKSDRVGIVGPILTVCNGWEKSGVQVYRKCWDDSKHVSHFAKYPVEYISELNKFITVLGLETQQKTEFVDPELMVNMQ